VFIMTFIRPVCAGLVAYALEILQKNTYLLKRVSHIFKNDETSNYLLEIS